MISANCRSRLSLKPTLPGLMRYLASAAAQAGCSLQQRVTVVVEIADQRRVHAEDIEPLADVRHGGRGLGTIDGDAHQLGAGARERSDLSGRRLDIGRVGIGHRLDDDRGIAAQRDVADPDRDGVPAR